MYLSLKIVQNAINKLNGYISAKVLYLLPKNKRSERYTCKSVRWYWLILQIRNTIPFKEYLGETLFFMGIFQLSGLLA